jgi:hypothetical protein
MLSRQITGVPLLRIRPDGPPGLDGVSIELNELSLSSPGPTIFLNCPPPSDPTGGRIFLQPDPLANGLIIESFGTSSHEGVSLHVGDPVIPPYRPRIQFRKPIVPGEQSGIILSGVEEGPRILVTNLTPSIVRLTADSDSPGELNKIHLDFDLPNRTMQWKESELVFARTFENDIPKLNERISSLLPGLENSFFDITYQLDDPDEGGTHTESYKDLQLYKVYQPGVPEYGNILFSGNPLYVDSFFDIAYRLDDGSHSLRFGSEATGLTLLH